MRWRCSRHCVRTGAMRACGRPARARTDRDAYLAELHAQARAAAASPTSSRSPRRPTPSPMPTPRADLVLQLSRKPEAFGRTVIEAIVIGRPVVGWDHGGVGELLHALRAARRRAALRRDALWHARRDAACSDAPPPRPVTMPHTLACDAGGDARGLCGTHRRLTMRHPRGDGLALGAGLGAGLRRVVAGARLCRRRAWCSARSRRSSSCCSPASAAARSC